MFRERSQGIAPRKLTKRPALILSSGASAYSIARQRAQEASSDEIANDWSGVAAAIDQRTRKRPPWLAHGFH
jgi:hypothetical protein